MTTWTSASSSPNAFEVHRSMDTVGTVASRVWFCFSWRSSRALWAAHNSHHPWYHKCVTLWRMISCFEGSKPVSCHMDIGFPPVSSLMVVDSPLCSLKLRSLHVMYKFPVALGPWNWNREIVKFACCVQNNHWGELSLKSTMFQLFSFRPIQHLLGIVFFTTQHRLRLHSQALKKRTITSDVSVLVIGNATSWNSVVK